MAAIIQPDQRFSPKQAIYQQGETLDSLYVIKSGAVKTYITRAEGQERISAFYLPGEIIGFESIAGETHLNTAIALGDSRLCKIKYSNLADLRKENPMLSDWAIHSFSRALASNHEFFYCLSLLTAKARLATFLLNISRRSGLSTDYQLSFNLLMSRQEIANYLGLAPETTSRAFSSLVKNHCVEKSKRQINIIDLDQLQEFAAA